MLIHGLCHCWVAPLLKWGSVQPIWDHQEVHTLRIIYGDLCILLHNEFLWAVMFKPEQKKHICKKKGVIPHILDQFHVLAAGVERSRHLGYILTLQRWCNAFYFQCTHVWVKIQPNHMSLSQAKLTTPLKLWRQPPTMRPTIATTNPCTRN